MNNQNILPIRVSPEFEDTVYIDNLQFRKIVEGINDLVYIYAKDNRILYMNPAMVEKQAGMLPAISVTRRCTLGTHFFPGVTTHSSDWVNRFMGSLVA